MWFFTVLLGKQLNTLTKRMSSGGFWTEKPSKSEIAKFHSSLCGDEDVCWLDICCSSHAADIYCQPQCHSQWHDFSKPYLLMWIIKFKSINHMPVVVLSHDPLCIMYHVVLWNGIICPVCPIWAYNFRMEGYRSSYLKEKNLRCTLAVDSQING